MDIHIVLVKLDGEYLWFRSVLEDWFLDYKKWGKAFRLAGYGNEPLDASGRFDILILDHESVHEFIIKMADFRESLEHLKEEFLLLIDEAEDWFSINKLLPTLFVDFDSRKLWSVHSEPSSIEKFVPAGWEGVEEDFFEEVPEDVAYWIVDGRNTLNKFDL